MRKLIILSASLIAQIIYSQQDPSAQNANGLSNTASPNVASFMRFQESSVDHYNGRSNFSIPIFEINVGGIKYPISLNYSQGGIQVNSVASDVGLGWSLTSTFVNRTVVGDADLETIIDDRPQHKSKYGYFAYKSGFHSINEPNDINVDFYPDLFKFVSPTNSSKFYFRYETSAVGLDRKRTLIRAVTKSIPHNYIKDFNGNFINNTVVINDYSEFEITTKDAISYLFKDRDLNHSFTYDGYYDSSYGNIYETYPRASTWYVSEISNLNNNEKIYFQYDTYLGRDLEKVGDIIANHPFYKYETFFSSTTVQPYENNLFYRSNPGQSNNGKFFNRLLESQRIKKINFRGGSVEFVYDKDRLDLFNGKALTGILIKDSNGGTIKEFELKYDYFYSDLQINEFSKRLKLISVQEKGQNKYQFDYYEDSKLPNIGSTRQDIFGYNNSVDGSEPSADQVPLYFYYPNKKEYSILPYEIENSNDYYPLLDPQRIIHGPQISKEPNDLSKIWSLKTVTLPTGGKNTFVLESNTFNLWGNNLKGGGTRIQQQIIQESAGGQQRSINYFYNKDQNVSSGYLFNMPQVGYPASILTQNEINEPWLRNYFVLFSNAKVNYDLLNNFFIGYSKVEENENGIKTIYEFTNDEQANIETRSRIPYLQLTPFGMHNIGEFLINNSSYGSQFNIDNSYKRGKLKYAYYYDKDNHLVKKKENIYKGYEGTDVENFPDRFYAIGTSIYQNPNGPTYPVSELMQSKKSYNSIYNNLVSTKTTNYLPSGNVEEVSNMNYDVYQNVTEVSHKTGNGTTFPIIDLIKYLYPYNFPDRDVVIDAFSDNNKSDTPILIKSYSGEINPSTITNPGSQYLTSQSKVEFSVDGNTSNLLLPTQALTAIGQNSFYEVGKFDRYDSRGNLLQSTKDGLSTTYLYGYNQLYPIAKVEGATYDQVMTALGVADPTSNSSYLTLDIVTKSNADIDETSENKLITALDTFRKHANLANFRVTTYTHNPLVGVTSVTPPSGMREVYIYEAVTNKLKEVKRMEKDAGGNDVYRTLKEYEYHYKPQN